ncbi:MAG: zeta toxin family protein [Methanospirillaceae archaeon]|nr:zeta toxin family protein [Methanospirillaceae archaeon]
MRIFSIFAGPNGSGKSTIVPDYSDLVFVNADYCAKEHPVISKMPDGFEKIKSAQMETERLIHEMISDGISFTWETVFSHPSRLEIMKHAKKNGYKIHLTYITTKHPDINVQRVRSRVLQGGHDVPEDKIRSRYNRSVSFLPQMILEADEVLIYDNSYEKTNPTLLFQKIQNGKPDFKPEYIFWDLKDEEIREWAIEHIMEPLSDMGFILHCYKLTEGEDS